MKMLLVSALALGGLTSAALAGPIALTDAQMDSVTAGQTAAEAFSFSRTSLEGSATASSTGEGAATSSFSGSAFAESGARATATSGNNND